MKPAIRLQSSATFFCRHGWSLGLLGVVLVAPGLVAADDAKNSAQAHPELWPAMQSPVARNPELDRRVQQLLARMSVEEKVGQVVQADIGSVTPEDVRKHRLGSVLAGGNSDPGGDYHA